jgi:hypothetical protein
VQPGKVLYVIEVKATQQLFDIDQTIPPPCANEFVVTTPSPISWVLNNAGSHHVHIHVPKTIQ